MPDATIELVVAWHVEQKPGAGTSNCSNDANPGAWSLLLHAAAAPIRTRQQVSLASSMPENRAMDVPLDTARQDRRGRDPLRAEMS
jgi:hypothetical protein